MKAGSGEKLQSKTGVTQPSKTCITPIPGTATDLPFREWSDKEMREENWDDVEWPYSKQSKSSKYDPKKPKRFQDQQNVFLPYSIPVHEWKEAADIFPDANFVVYSKDVGYSDLISGSKHLLHSEFMRSFISSIHTLMYLGKTTKFCSQYISPNFIPTTDDSPWQPWHHVYSNKTAGTRQEHNPTVNKIGKYVVRLYWLGAWRKIYVSDRIPVDPMGNLLLPSTAKPVKESKFKSRIFYQEKEPIELWPYLLIKALLKLASLTYYEDREMVDFDIIQCLTGWVPQKINTKGLPISDIWKICWAYTSHYPLSPILPSKDSVESTKNKNEDKGMQELMAKKQRKVKEKGKDNENVEQYGEKDVKEQKDVKEKKEEPQKKLIGREATSYYVVASCNDLRNLKAEDEVPNFSPCLQHEFLIVQTKDIPLKPIEGMTNWRRIRWLTWAAQKGIVSNEQLQPQNYKVVSAFKKGFENNADQQDIMPSKAVSTTSVKIRLNPARTSDPSSWIDQEKLSQQINEITIYFKPSEFKKKIMISNMYKEGKGSYDDEWTVFEQPIQLNKYSNEPIYIFSESLDSQLLLINLSQAGYTDTLFNQQCDKGNEELNPVKSSVSETASECEFCLAAFVKRMKGEIYCEDERESIPVPKIEQDLIKHPRSCSHIVIENYNWQTETLGESVAALNTYGSKSTILHFEPGRKVLKLWLKSDTSYVAYIFSDDDIVVGDLETILSCMSDESQLLNNVCTEVADNFLHLIDAFGLSKFPQQLKAFYNSYKPKQSLTKAECIVLHDTFFDLLLKLVKDNLSDYEMYALKVFFLRWQNNPRLEYPEFYNVCNCFDDDDLKYLKSLERSVIQIQALFRGIHERSLMSYHDSSHKDHYNILTSLLNIYSKIFSIDSRYTTCADLLRGLLAHPAMQTIKRKYEFYQDLDNVLTLKEVIHNISETKRSVSECQWALICRQPFSVISEEPIPVKINLFCNIDQYVVRVVDNDTSTEMKRYINNVAVSKYKSNVNGYTVLCYAWSPFSKQIKCKLSFATKREVNDEKLDTINVNTELKSFHGMYMPNINNTVCKYLVYVRAERALLSIHFVSSYADAMLNFKLYDEKGKILKEVTGKGDIILPAIMLDYREVDDDESISSTVSLERGSKTKNKDQNAASRESYPIFHGTESSSGYLESYSSRSHRSKHSVDGHGFSSSLHGLHNSDSHNQEDPYFHALHQRFSGREACESRSTHDGYDDHVPKLHSGKSNLRFKKLSAFYHHHKTKWDIKASQPVKYVIEVSVEDDSWPLTAEEWKNLETPIPDGQVSTFGSAVKDVANRINRLSLKAKRSTLVLKPQRKSRSSFKASQKPSPKAGSNLSIAKRNQLLFDNPYWIMQIVLNHGELVDIIKSAKQEIKLKQAKYKWAEKDEGRAERAQEIRRKFLKEHVIANPRGPFNEWSDIRSLVKEEVAAYVLPPLDLTAYMTKDPQKVHEDNRKLKNLADFHLDRRREALYMEKYETKYKNSRNKLESIITEQNVNHNIANKWFDRVRTESHAMMEEAMNLRNLVIMQLISKKDRAAAQNRNNRKRKQSQIF